MAKMTTDLVALANAGASLEINAPGKLSTDLSAIARALKPGATLKLRSCNGKMTTELSGVARASGPGQVILAFD